MNDYGGRPHWGKLHFQTAETLAPRYPEWERFQAVREQLDPERPLRQRLHPTGARRMTLLAEPDAPTSTRPATGRRSA